MSSKVTFQRLTDDYLADITEHKNSEVAPEAAKKLLWAMEYDGTAVITEDGADGLREAAAIAISRIRNKSYREYRIFNNFFDFLANEHKHSEYSFTVEHLPRQMTALERQLTLAKLLHDKDTEEFSEDELAIELMVSPDTIRNDLQALRDGINVFDQRFCLEYKRYNRRVKMTSTVHPFFLTQNLTQIVFILEGLRVQDTRIKRGYVEDTAISIWIQLSDYARKRILDVLCDLMDLDKRWYEDIDDKARSRESRDMFSDEKHVGSDAGGRQLLMYCFKGSIPCNITYTDKDGEVVDTGAVRISDLREDEVDVMAGDTVTKIKDDDIESIIALEK